MIYGILIPVVIADIQRQIVEITLGASIYTDHLTLL